MGTLIIHIITIMGITRMATFRSIVISMNFIISVSRAALIVTLAVVTSVVILLGVTTVAVMGGEGALDRRDQGRGRKPLPSFTLFMQKVSYR
jgi:hypothetical protein